MNKSLDLLPARRDMERAFARKDAAFDGVFYVAVRTTGVFCRPSCPSRASLVNTEFFGSARACLEAGYRPCKRCHPLEADGTAPEWARRVMARVESEPDVPLRAGELAEFGVSPERARRWFRHNLGMSLAAWCRGRRLAGAFRELREGSSLDDAGLGAGYASPSGFREAFQRVFGATPGMARGGGAVVTLSVFESPLGPLLAGVLEDGACLLEFGEPGRLVATLERLGRRWGGACVPGAHPLLDRLGQELREYFEGRRRAFSVPCRPRGTAFQERVWAELVRIPFGQTISYEELARRIGQPTARRAVALANGANPLAILVPCHRVIGKDGRLTGYGGGLWRKRLLLELERTGKALGNHD